MTIAELETMLTDASDDLPIVACDSSNGECVGPLFQYTDCKLSIDGELIIIFEPADADSKKLTVEELRAVMEHVPGATNVYVHAFDTPFAPFVGTAYGELHRSHVAIFGEEL